jgi:nitroreductase
MDALEAILSRRSCRSYTDEPIAAEQIEQLLRSGMASPTACNQRPWHFVVVDDRDTLCRISDIQAYAPMLKQAPLAIVVCSDGGQADLSAPYWPQDCAAATQNMLIAARALGLGAVWLGIYPDAARVAGLRTLLCMPESVTPFCVVAVGHPAKPPRPIDRYEPERVHRNKW